MIWVLVNGSYPSRFAIPFAIGPARRSGYGSTRPGSGRDRRRQTRSTSANPVDLGSEMLSVESLCVRVVFAGGPVDLRGENELVAVPVREPFPDVAFGASAAVDIDHVDEVATCFRVPVEDSMCLLAINLFGPVGSFGANARGPEREFTDLEARLS